MDRRDNIEGSNVPAHFKKDPNQPYGFYIPILVIRYVADPTAFQPGVAIAFPKGADDDELSSW